MPINLQNTIFERYYTKQDKVLDPNKDINGKGTAERYNEIIGQDVDQDLLPFIDDAHDNLIVPETMFERYIIDREQSLGNNVLFLGLSVEMRRRILKHWLRYVSIKGTKRCYEVLFAMLGITGITITELFSTGGFDSSETFDSELRPTFDSGRCAPCSLYSIELIGPPLTTEIYNAIFSIILFNEPINAVLNTLTYNGINLNNIVTNWTYETNLLGSHTPSVVNSGPTAFWIFEAGAPFVVSNTPTYNYLTATAKTVEVFIDDFNQLQGVNLNNQAVFGAVDLSQFVGTDSFDFGLNTGITSVTFPSSTTNIDLVDFESTGLTTIDLSPLTNLGGSILLQNCSSLTTITLPAAISGALTLEFNAANTDLTGDQSLETIPLDTGANVFIRQCPNVGRISFGTTVQTNNVGTLDFSNNPTTTNINISVLQGSIDFLNIRSNTSLTGLILGTAFVRPSGGSINMGNTSALLGVLDMSSFPIAGDAVFNGSGITSIIHANNNEPVDIYFLDNCPNLTYFSIVNVEGILGANNARFRATDSGLSATEVDNFLGDLVTICITLRGEPAGGLFSGRQVDIAGASNAAPTATGIAFAAQLTSLSITVTTN